MYQVERLLLGRRKVLVEEYYLTWLAQVLKADRWARHLCEGSYHLHGNLHARNHVKDRPQNLMSADHVLECLL